MNLKERLRKKLKKNGGFTLIEMLIVVAIIAILVVVSIPMVSASLEDAKENTDKANERAAKSAAVITYMADDFTAGDFYYDANDGDIVDTAPSNGYGQCSDHKDGYLKVSIAANGNVTLTWEAATGTTVTGDPHLPNPTP